MTALHPRTGGGESTRSHQKGRRPRQWLLKVRRDSCVVLCSCKWETTRDYCYREWGVVESFVTSCGTRDILYTAFSVVGLQIIIYYHTLLPLERERDGSSAAEEERRRRRREDHTMEDTEEAEGKREDTEGN